MLPCLCPRDACVCYALTIGYAAMPLSQAQSMLHIAFAKVTYVESSLSRFPCQSRLIHSCLQLCQLSAYSSLSPALSVLSVSTLSSILSIYIFHKCCFFLAVVINVLFTESTFPRIRSPSSPLSLNTTYLFQFNLCLVSISPLRFNSSFYSASTLPVFVCRLRCHRFKSHPPSLLLSVSLSLS
jgi:hypothetical protein